MDQWTLSTYFTILFWKALIGHCYPLSRDDSEHRVSSKGTHQLASLHFDEAAKKLRIIKHNKNIVMYRLFLCDFQTVDLTQNDFCLITNFGKKRAFY
jgi:hypothetical protein